MRYILPAMSLMLLASLTPADDAPARRYEFPAGVPFKASEVTWYAPTNHYQHGGTVHDRRYNISAAKPFEKFGNANYEFPWRTGGLDNSPNGSSFLFHRLPESGKIVYWREPARERVTRNIHWRQDPVYRWRYPEGTVFGEVLKVDGQTFEVRVMTRGSLEWKFQVYRPFAKRSELAKYLSEKADVRAVRLVNPHPDQRVIDERVSAEDLDMTADAVQEVLSRKFRDVTGVKWDEDAGSYGPATTRKGQIVPANFQGHFFGADTCIKCHATTGEAVSAFQINRDWYGAARGSDAVLSFSIFDDHCASDNGYPRQVILRRDLPLVRREGQ